MTRFSNWQKSMQKWRDGLLQVKETAYTCEEIQSSWQTNLTTWGLWRIWSLIYSHYNQCTTQSYILLEVMRLWLQIEGNLNLITSCIAIAWKPHVMFNITSFYCYSCCYCNLNLASTGHNDQIHKCTALDSKLLIACVRSAPRCAGHCDFSTCCHSWEAFPIFSTHCSQCILSLANLWQTMLF